VTPLGISRLGYLGVPEYPSLVKVWKVSNAGCFRLHSEQHFQFPALNGEYLGLEEVRDESLECSPATTRCSVGWARTRRLPGRGTFHPPRLQPMSPDPLLTTSPGAHTNAAATLSHRRDQHRPLPMGGRGASPHVTNVCIPRT